MKDRDIVIVGGGPAGSSLALHLVRAEKVDPERILVLDKATFPRDKPCAGAVSELGLEVLTALDVAVTVPRVTLTGLRLILGGDVAESEGTMGICIRRTQFDAMLLDLVRADGVKVCDGEGLSGINRRADGSTLTTTHGRQITTRFVAACDGAGSTTRKLLGIREPERKGHLYVLETDPTTLDRGVGRGLADFDLSVLHDRLEGYYWDFPTPMGGQVSRGIYDANLKPNDVSLKDVLARSLARRGIDIEETVLRPFSTRPFVPTSIAWVPGVVLVGEACGIDQTTGEGIAQAIDMARIAAPHLARACVSGSPHFHAYERAVRASTTGRHMLQSAWMARRVYGRIGQPARRYLIGSAYARRAAMKWYRGEKLDGLTHVRLGLGLAASLRPRLQP